VGEDETVRLTLSQCEGGVLCTIEAPFHGDPPPDGPPGSRWELWEHEVVELFIVGEGDPTPYTEIEVGPYGHYLVLKLCGERNVVERELPLSVQCKRTAVRWSGRFLIPFDYLPTGTLRLNGYAIHGVGTARRYLVATTLGGNEPDFHRVDSFRLLLEFTPVSE